MIKDAYADATKTAGNFAKQSREVTMLQTQQSLLALQGTLRTQSRSAVGEMTHERPQFLSDSGRMGIPGDFPMLIPGGRDVSSNLRAFEETIQRFNRSVEAGSPDIIRFRDEVAQIGNAAAASDPKLAAQANKLLENTKAVGDTAFAINQAEASIRLLNGTATEADRKLLGIAGASNKASSSLRALTQRTRDRIAELQLEAQTAGQASDAVMKLKLMHDLERAAKKDNITVNEALRKSWRALADEMAAADRLRNSNKLTSDLQFERDQLFRSEADQTIASRLRSANLPIDFNGVQAGMIRYNEQLKQARDLTLEIGQGFARDVRAAIESGAKGWEVFQQAGMNALQKLSDKLMDMAMNQMINGLFRMVLGGGTGMPMPVGGGGILGGLFGGGGGLNVGTIGGTGLLGFGGMFADGGNLSRGWGVVGERGPEIIKAHNGGGVTIFSNTVSKAIARAMPRLPGFADGGMLVPGGGATGAPQCFKVAA